MVYDLRRFAWQRAFSACLSEICTWKWHQTVLHACFRFFIKLIPLRYIFRFWLPCSQSRSHFSRRHMSLCSWSSYDTTGGLPWNASLGAVDGTSFQHNNNYCFVNPCRAACKQISSLPYWTWTAIRRLAPLLSRPLCLFIVTGQILQKTCSVAQVIPSLQNIFSKSPIFRTLLNYYTRVPRFFRAKAYNLEERRKTFCQKYSPEAKMRATCCGPVNYYRFLFN